MSCNPLASVSQGTSDYITCLCIARSASSLKIMRHPLEYSLLFKDSGGRRSQLQFKAQDSIIQHLCFLNSPQGNSFKLQLIRSLSSGQTISTPGLDYIHTRPDYVTSAIPPKISLDRLTHLCPSLPILPTVKLIACQMVPAKSTLLGRQIT
jgi:hypothetical protein